MTSTPSSESLTASRPNVTIEIEEIIIMTIFTLKDSQYWCFSRGLDWWSVMWCHDIVVTTLAVLIIVVRPFSIQRLLSIVYKRLLKIS